MAAKRPKRVRFAEGTKEDSGPDRARKGERLLARLIELGIMKNTFTTRDERPWGGLMSPSTLMHFLGGAACGATSCVKHLVEIQRALQLLIERISDAECPAEDHPLYQPFLSAWSSIGAAAAASTMPSGSCS